MTRLVLITLLVFGPRRRRGRSLITRSFFTTASVTVPLPAIPVTSVPIIQQRRAFRVTKRVLTVIAASSRRRKSRCA